MKTVAFDLSPLESGHAGRGVGTYTRLLHRHLLKLADELQIVPFDSPIATEASLLHYPYFDLFFSSLPLFKKLPTIVTIHDVIPLLFPPAYSRGKKGSLALIHQRLALCNVKAIITDSQASKNGIMKHLGIVEPKIHVVYLAANPELEAQNQESIDRVARKYHLPKKYILYVGDINYNKNLPQLIKSLKFLPDDLHLVCVGSNFRHQHIPEWQAIETQMAMSNVLDRIHYLTELPIDKLDTLAAIYSGALAYVQPSLAEGFGLPVLEAMQCKTPVIAAHNSSLIEVGGQHALFVEPAAEAIAEGVKTVCDWSVTHRQEVIRKAYSWTQAFSWDKVADETLQIYQKFW